MTDSFVQVAPDSTGKKIDNSQLTQDGGAIVQRQRVSIGDDASVDNHAAVDSAGNLQHKIGPGPVSLLTAAVINNSAGGLIALCAGSSGLRVKLHRIWLVVGGPTNLTFQDGSTPLSGPAPLLQGGGITLDFSGDPWYISSVGAALNINSSAAVQISGTAYYVQS